MPNELIDRKLEQHIIPYIVSGKRLKRQWFYKTNTLFGYTTDLLGASASIGLVVPPALAFLAGDTGATDAAGTTVAGFTGLPTWLYYPVLIVAIVWVVLRVVFTRENGQKRAVLARSAAASMRQAEAQLHRFLVKADPMTDLNDLLDKHLGPVVDRTMQEEAWPWAPFSPDIDKEVRELSGQLIARYGNNWTPPPASGVESLPKT